MNSLSWRPPSGPLGRLIRAAHERAASLDLEVWRERALAVPRPPDILAALRRPRPSVALIAEIKRSSPSRGVINAGMDVVERGLAYLSGGAAALSVLTEPGEFGGDPRHLEQLRRVAEAPLLKKDFHVADVHVLEARALGASALLLIARGLEPSRLRDLVHLAHATDVEPLVEVRTPEELSDALDAGARMVGVNARDLETLEVDHRVPRELIPRVPADIVAVAESGIALAEDVERAAGFGADAVLVGSALSEARNPVAAATRFAGVPWRGRAP